MRTQLKPPAKVSKATHDELLRLYSEPHREYHNLDHILKCQQNFERLQKLMAFSEEDILRIDTMIWFHDAIYKVGPDIEHGANEADSAAFFMDHSEEFTNFQRSEIENAILATAAHTKKQVLSSINGFIFLDIDLSSMGSSYKDFLMAGANIRREYGWVDNGAFWEARIKFFKSLLTSRPYIFYNQVMRGMFEEQARSNIEQWLRECGE